MTIGSFAAEQTAMKLILTWAGQGQAFLVASVRSPADAAQAAWESYVRLAEALSQNGLEVVQERIFGSLSVEPSVMAARHRALQTYGFAVDNPITYVQGNPPWGDGFAGTIIHAVAPNDTEDVWTIQDNGVACGRGWRRNGLTYLMLQNITGTGREDLTLPLSNPAQTGFMFERAERILRDNNASYKNVARTWLFLSKILEWYPEFNKARSEKYGEFGIMSGPGDIKLLLPASTGIGADTPSGAAASMDLLAVVDDDTNKDISSVSFPLVGNPSGERLRTSRSDKSRSHIYEFLSNSHPRVRLLSNRKQLDAFRYGAAFSRGAVISEDDVDIIQISGTAAIDEHGVSLYPGDIRSQINCTFDRIETLLNQEGAGLRDIAAATVFVKSPKYAPVFWKMAADRGLSDFPAVCVVADVCREELLFEIDAEAVVKRESL